MKHVVLIGHRTGHQWPHVPTEMTGSVAGNDDAVSNGRSFRRLV
jgi:hypothetical protein